MGFESEEYGGGFSVGLSRIGRGFDVVAGWACSLVMDSVVVRCRDVAVVKGLGCRGAWKVGDGFVGVLAEEKWGWDPKKF